jgi:hypothetical protein
MESAELIRMAGHLVDILDIFGFTTEDIVEVSQKMINHVEVMKRQQTVPERTPTPMKAGLN